MKTKKYNIKHRKFPLFQRDFNISRRRRLNTARKFDEFKFDNRLSHLFHFVPKTRDLRQRRRKYAFSSIPFSFPDTYVCKRRKRRRESLFAFSSIGKGISVSPHRKYNSDSFIVCK